MTLPDGVHKQLELQTRYVLLAPWVEGQRILDLGGHSIPGLVQLIQSGASELAVTHSDIKILAEALEQAGLEGIDIQVDGESLPYADGTFDMVICHDLAERLTAQPQFAAEVRRVLGPEGYLITAVANPQGRFLSEVGQQRFTSSLNYQSLNDYLTPLFNALTTFGQFPVTGSLFFDFGDTSEETGLSIDRALLPEEDEQPGWYLLVYGPEEKHRDDLAVVQLPFDLSVDAATSAPRPTHASESHGQALGSSTPPQPGLADAHARNVIATLEDDRRAALAHAQTVETALYAAQRTLRELSTGGGDVSQQLAQAHTDIANLQQQLTRAQTALEAARAEAAHEQAMRQAAEANSVANVVAVQQEFNEAHGQMRSAFSAREEALNARLEDLETSDRYATLEAELERTRHDKASYESQIRDLLEEVTALREREQKRQQEVQQLQSANSAAHQALLQVQNQMQAQDERVFNADPRVGTLMRELESLREELHSSQVARQGLETEVARLRSQSSSSLGQGVASRPRDAVGRVLDSAVEELEDLLKDVAPPVTSGR